MTYSELVQSVEKLKKVDLACDLLPGCFGDYRLYVVKQGVTWEVYGGERGPSDLLGTFYTQSDLYEYILCCYKENSDRNRWF